MNDPINTNVRLDLLIKRITSLNRQLGRIADSLEKLTEEKQ